MIEFSHIVRDEAGIHARPAGLLVKTLQAFSCAVTIWKSGKTGGDAATDDTDKAGTTPDGKAAFGERTAGKKADGKKLFQVMTLGVRRGDAITLLFEGDDEVAASAAARVVLEENL